MLGAMPDTTEETKTKRLITQLRVEPELWERIKEQARRRRMSANNYVLVAAERMVIEDEKAQAAV